LIKGEEREWHVACMICRCWSALPAPDRHRPQLHVFAWSWGRQIGARRLPRAPTLEDGTILGLIMAFWGTPHDTLVSGTLLDAGKIVG
jgi:hypothetical protein